MKSETVTPRTTPKETLKKLYSAEEFGRLTGRSMTTVFRLLNQLTEVDSKGQKSAKRYHINDIISLIEEKARNKTPDTGKDAKERAELARAEKIEIDNAVRRGQLVPLVNQVAWESKRSGMLARALDTIPSRIKRKYPDMPGKYLAALSDLLAIERNSIVDTLEDEVKHGIESDDG